MPHARSGLRATALLLTVALALGGCVDPFSDEPKTSEEPLDEFAEPAEDDVVEPPEAPAEQPSDEGPEGTGATEGPGGAGSTGGDGTTGGTGGTDAPAGAGGQPSSSARVVLNVADRAGDADTLLDDSPPYADALQVTIESIGADARVTVRVAEGLPGQLADGEVIGIGVDLFRTNGRESDYQLFADGGVDGWRAFLQTPDGFIEYPGAFAVSGELVQFRVPWSALGGEPTGTVKVFLDWSARGNLGLVSSTSDRVPDRGAATYR